MSAPTRDDVEQAIGIVRERYRGDAGSAGQRYSLPWSLGVLVEIAYAGGDTGWAAARRVLQDARARITGPSPGSDALDAALEALDAATPWPTDPVGLEVPGDVGERVHYVAHGSADGTYPLTCRAADITEPGAWVTESVHTGEPAENEHERYLRQRWDPLAAYLHVLNPTGLFVNGPHRLDVGAPPRTDGPTPGPLLCDGRTHAPGTWHRPGPVALRGGGTT